MSSPTNSNFKTYCDAFHTCAREIINAKERRTKVRSLVEGTDNRATIDQFVSNINTENISSFFIGRSLVIASLVIR